tara:strand:+ start:426 stop:575 length:150 start_codon:yes stop_codon:yes gene_type:complete
MMGKMKRLWEWMKDNEYKINKKGDNGLNNIYDIYIYSSKHNNGNKKGIK